MSSTLTVRDCRRRSFILATAGHVDHGKSAMVHRLTQQATDRLPEEKRRGITIDLGFANWLLKDPEQSLLEYDLGLIDVPGHEDFVKNMVTGVGCIDAALLVVAADDGWMPQTEEHFQILNYLGVETIIVVITKIDLTNADPNLVEAMIREELCDTPHAQAPIIAISAHSGQGMETLGLTVAQALRQKEPHLNQGKPRIPVDRAFSVRGLGTVVTGTLAGGMLEADQIVSIKPGHLETKIRSIEHHHARHSHVDPGMRVALNLSSVAVRKGNQSPESGVGRGQVVTTASLGCVTHCLDGVMERSSRLYRPDRPKPCRLRSGSRVWLHHGATQVLGRIEFPSGNPMAEGGSSPFRLTLESPCFALEGDPFVIRDGSQQETLGGGRIWDTEATAIRFRSERQLTYLGALSATEANPGAYLEARLIRDHGLAGDTFHDRGIWTAKQLAREAALLAKTRGITRQQGWLLDSSWWMSLLESIVSRIGLYHQEHPDLKGFPIETLRHDYLKQLPHPSLWKSLIAALTHDHGLEQAGEFLCHPDHHVALPDRLEAMAAKLMKQLSEHPLDPPYRRHIDLTTEAGDTLRCLIRMGKIIELNSEMVMIREAFDQLVDQTRNWLLKEKSSTVSQIKQALGISRRVAIPFLEKIDREGLTQRHGDQRSWKA